MRMRTVLGCLLAATLACAGAPQALAQAWPAKPVTIVVPLAPGIVELSGARVE